MKKYIQNKKVQLVFALIGAAGGFLYWKFVGCLDGTCPIRSVWYWSTLWGTAAGYLTGDIVNDFRTKRKKKREGANGEHKISEHN
ncbi:MAG: hypothetical protein JW833_06005 [Prolixibacteraceae bacterium]|nr:hypothetical protein [Prolixibacteraceae bacterium]